ncbi:MAG TPA: hypothetical protein VF384_14035 [Planctomycetota bacterium]
MAMPRDAVEERAIVERTTAPVNRGGQHAQRAIGVVRTRSAGGIRALP